MVPLVMNKRAQRADFPGRLYQILNSPWVQNCNEFLRNNINVYLLPVDVASSLSPKTIISFIALSLSFKNK